jgi:TonB family protein
MMLLVDSGAKVALLLLLALAIARLWRRPAAAVRHWMLSVAIGCAVAMPLASLVAPSWTIGLAPEARRDAEQSTVTTRIITQNQERINPRAARAADPAAVAGAVSIAGTAPRLLAAIWIAGALVTLSTLVVGLTRLRRMAAAARPLERGPWVREAARISEAIGLRRPIVLLQSDHPTLLVTWGLKRPKVILPAAAREWTGERARIVLRHELAHIRRGDWSAQMAGELLRIVYWFNPLVWIACTRLRQESEHACDDDVLNSGVEATDYASHLVDLARTLSAARCGGVPAPAMARTSNLEGRISAMLNDHLDRRPLTRSTRIAVAAAFVIVTASIAGLAAQGRYSTFSGTVLDETNGFLPDATLVLTNTASRARHEVRSDRTGHFEFVGLPAGEYVLMVTQLGFAPLTESIAIVGRDLVQVMQLQVGSLQEMITITGGRGPSAPGASDASDAIRAQALAQRRQSAQERQDRATERCAGAASGGVGGNILQPHKLLDVRPVYPEHLTSAGIGGTVTMDTLVGIDGRVRDVRVLSSPHSDLERSAVDAVRAWEFSTTILNCTPVEVRMHVTANFVARP